MGKKSSKPFIEESPKRRFTGYCFLCIFTREAYIVPRKVFE